MSGISTMETNIRTYTGIEQETVSLIHWPSDASPLLNVGCKEPSCADVDAALTQVWDLLLVSRGYRCIVLATVITAQAHVRGEFYASACVASCEFVLSRSCERAFAC